MVRQISPEVQERLEAGALVARDFLRITARARDTLAPVGAGFWSGLGPISAPVVDAEMGFEVVYDFEGVGGLIVADPIPLVSDLTVQSISLKFSGLDDRLDYLVRAYDVGQAPIQIYRGFFDPETLRLAAPASPRFTGFVDGAPIETPASGSVGSITLRCVSCAQEMTRSNPDLRSDESQQARAAGDAFYRDVATIGAVQCFWGRKASSVGGA